MKTEGLTAEEATEIIQRGGVVEDSKNKILWSAQNTKNYELAGLLIPSAYAPYRVVKLPPDAEPVVTAEEFLAAARAHRGEFCTDPTLDKILADLKAARKPKPEPQPIRTLAEALACAQLRLMDSDGHYDIVYRAKGWLPTERAAISWYIDGYDKGRRVYDASEKEQTK